MIRKPSSNLQSSRMITQLEEFADEHGVNQTAVQNITKTLVAIPKGNRNYRVPECQVPLNLTRRRIPII